MGRCVIDTRELLWRDGVDVVRVHIAGNEMSQCRILSSQNLPLNTNGNHRHLEYALGGKSVLIVPFFLSRVLCCDTNWKGLITKTCRNSQYSNRDTKNTINLSPLNLTTTVNTRKDDKSSRAEILLTHWSLASAIISPT